MTPPRILAVGEEPPPMDTEPRPERNGRQKCKPKGKPASSGRFQCINAFIDATMAGLPPAERAVWFILWRDTKPDGLARTSQADIARRAGVSDRAVRSALSGLLRRRLLAVVCRGNLRRGASIYRVRPVEPEPS